MPNNQPPILDYRSPPPPRRPSARLALLFCLPGLLCWLVFFTNDVHRDIGIGLILNFAESVTGVQAFTFILILWGLAILTALASLIYYAIRLRDTREWYVLCCLALNIIGLLFSVFMMFA